MNDQIIKEFEKLILNLKNLDLNKNTDSNYFRIKQLSNSLSIIKKYKKQILSGDELKDIKGIGSGTISRIDEILKNGYLKENLEYKNNYIDTGDLENIFGIGKKTAYKLVTKYKIKTSDDLIKLKDDKKIKLNNHILLGLKYRDTYQRSIPRSEMNMYNDIFIEVIQKINNNLEIVMCGSYRRNKSSSNDIDLLLTGDKSNNLSLKIFVDLLHKLKIIIEDIDPDYHVKYMGFIKYKNYPVRRLDIMYVNKENYYTALLHFTGSKDFNTRIRKTAQLLGYKLNQYGLYKNNKKITVKSEKEIFDILGLEYIKPENR
jgi:DNA polymerase/3'-5' exonuclease PolX